MQLYFFLKVKPILEKHQTEQEIKLKEAEAKKLKENEKLEVVLAKEFYKTDLTLTTEDKSLRLTPEQLQNQTKKSNEKTIEKLYNSQIGPTKIIQFNSRNNFQ